MKIKKLFKILVIGGSALGATQCGPSNDSNNQDSGYTNPDGGHNTQGDGGGTHFW
jgi:hypothetical protein